MKDPRSVVLVLLIGLVAGTESKSDQPGPVCSDPKQKLMNTAGYGKASISLSNQLDQKGVKWEYIPSLKVDGSETSETIAVNDSVQPKFVQYYTVNSTHLYIRTFYVFISISGLYTLTYNTDGCQSMANLIAVDWPPKCDCSKTETDSDNAVLTCQIQYQENNKYPNHAKMMWTTDCGQAYSGRPKFTRFSKAMFRAVSSHSITSSDAANFTCGVTFDAPKPSGPANMATNGPSFSASCTIANCVKKNNTKSPKESKSESQGPVCGYPNKQLLMNTAVYEGGSSSFSNRLDQKGVYWEIIPTSADDAILIALDNTVQPRFDGVYAVDLTHLNISFVTSFSGTGDDLPSSGLYMLTYRTDDSQWMANLIAVNEPPKCDCFKAETDSDYAVLMCQIKYAVKDKYPNHAKMIWTTDSAKAHSGIQKIIQSGDNEYTAISNHSITSSDAANYTCGVTFDAPNPSGPANMATNEPSFNASCTIANCVKKEKEKSLKDSKSEQPEPGRVCSDPDQKLMNKVVKYKASSSFSNQLDRKGVKWEIAPSYKGHPPSSSFTIADNDAVEPPYVGDYTVNSTHLNIRSVADIFTYDLAKPSTSGLYTVTYKTDGCQSMANLIAIYDGPTCACARIDSDNAALLCRIRYAVSDEYPNQAQTIWTTACGQSYSGTQEIFKRPMYVYVSRSYLSIKSSDAAKFTCGVTFSPPQPSGPENMAANAPWFNASCTVKNCIKTEKVIEEKVPKGKYDNIKF